MNPLILLRDRGQAVWLDFLARRFIADGGLKTLVERDGLRGVTSNPSIFEKAIAESGDYDDALKRLQGERDHDVSALYERLAVEDIQAAADVLRPVYEATQGRDGYVSLEVSPYLAMDTAATITEGRHLWKAVARENLMIKVPGTPAGLPAIRELIGEGINVNITLLFSVGVYEDVVEAYLAGLESFVSKGGDAGKMASVASFFVSRIDVAVEKRIGERLSKTRDPKTRDMLYALKSKVAIANAKLAYQRYHHLYSGQRWDALQAKGARPQRLLWASTSTKDASLRDVLYVEELIGADTVNTMPPATMDAFGNHGTVRLSLEENIAEAEQVMARLDAVGISMNEVTAKLVEDGVRLFSDAADKLLGAIAAKRSAFLGDALNGQTLQLPKDLGARVQATVEAWMRTGDIRRLWAGDGGLWTDSDEEKWLGWLTIVAEQQARIADLQAFAADVRSQDFAHILLLGMGGSSLGPEVIAKTFGHLAGWPELLVLDSTDPAQIRKFESRIHLARTLVIVSSKSGSTLEPNILKQYFYERVTQALSVEKAGARFVAITDPGSSLQDVAAHDGFRQVVLGHPSIGGRYSVLSDFGMMPAAAMGVDLEKFLALSQIMVRSCSAAVPPAENPGVLLGIVLAEAALTQRDKVTILASAGIADFGAWAEQLLAESTGKQGKGLIPIDAEPLGSPDVYGADRLFIHLALKGEANSELEQRVTALEAAGQPVVRIAVTSRYHLGQEFVRWQIATAVAGAILGINPFDQPDVEASKEKTRGLIASFEKTRAFPKETPFFEEHGVRLFADGENRKRLHAAGAQFDLAGWLKSHLAQLQSGDYFALLAYIERDKSNLDALQDIRVMVRDSKRVATCLGFGPRFLHSTGQAYKGGPDTGVFLQFTCDDAADLDVPGKHYSFGVVKAAEASGDFEELAERGRRLLRVHISGGVAEGLRILREAFTRALA